MCHKKKVERPQKTPVHVDHGFVLSSETVGAVHFVAGGLTGETWPFYNPRA